MHPIERIARLLLEFEGMQPFKSGNGKVGRILVNLELMQNGYPPINFRKRSAAEVSGGSSFLLPLSSA